MENFQLYSTNVLLGGNMKWDLILDKSDDKSDDLAISDVYITPISQQGAKFYQLDYKLLDNNHIDNIIDFYKNHIGYFYNPYIDNQLSSIYPLLNPEGKNYDDTFFMGCRRALYQKYKKQYNFFLPLWIEHINNFIKIVLTVKGKGLERSKTITLYSKELYKNNPSNKANKYFKEYFDKIGITNNGDDRVMNINLDSREAYINGLNVESGEIITKDVTLPLRNIYTRERPLMDIDSILLESWSSNHIIAKQLMNFNLCFNLEDIFEDIYLYDADPFITYQVSARVSIGNDVNIPLKDFYTNYKFIKKTPELTVKKYNPASNSIEDNEPEQNVFDYLSDNYYINYVDKNKIPVKYFHWSLADNNDYIFNLYEGFSGVNNPGYYGDSHDLINDDKIFFDVIEFEKSTDYTYFLQQIDNNKYIANIQKANTCCHYNKFNDKINDKINNIVNYKIIGIALPDNTMFSSDRNYEFVIHNLKYFFIKFNYNKLSKKELMRCFSYKALMQELNSKQIDENGNETDEDIYNNETDEYMLKLYLESYQKSPSVKFFNSLKKTLYKSPDKSSKEIDYYTDKKITTIFRLGGFIKPSFVDVGNILYYKKNIEDNTQDFKKYANTKFTPIYPSIGYCGFNSIDMDYINSDKNLVKKPEYPWFNNGEVFYLEKNIEANNISGKDLDSTIKKLLGFTKNDNELYTYIKNIYNIQYDLLESNLIDKEINYKFNIKMNLK